MLDDLQDLKGEREHLLRSNQDIITRAEKEDRPISDDEDTQYHENARQAKEIESKIEKLERHEERKRQAASALAAPASSTPAAPPSAGPRSDANDSGDGEPRISFYRAGSLKAFKREFDAYKAGQWFAAKILGSRSADRWCREHGVAAAMERKSVELRGHIEGDNTKGGVLVPDEWEQAVIDLRETYGVFRRESKISVMGSETKNVPRRRGGLTAYHVGERDTLPESTKNWDLVTLVAKKISVLSYYSAELGEDSIISIADDLAQESAYAFALREDTDGFLGDGTSTYGGITGVVTKLEQTGGDKLAGSVDAPSGVDSLAEITATHLSQLMAKLPEYATPNAKFYCSKAAKELIFGRLAVSAGGNTMGDIATGWQPSYLGHPIVTSQLLFSNDGATAGNGKVMLLFGDLRLASTMGDRRGIRYAMSEHDRFTTDEIAIRAIERIDINVHDVGDTTTPGAIVGLLGKT